VVGIGDSSDAERTLPFIGAATLDSKPGDTGQSLRETFWRCGERCVGSDGPEPVQELGGVAGPVSVGRQQSMKGIAKRIGAEPSSGRIAESVDGDLLGEAEGGGSGGAPHSGIGKTSDIGNFDFADTPERRCGSLRELGQE